MKCSTISGHISNVTRNVRNFMLWCYWSKIQKLVTFLVLMACYSLLQILAKIPYAIALHVLRRKSAQTVVSLYHNITSDTHYNVITARPNTNCQYSSSLPLPLSLSLSLSLQRLVPLSLI